MTSTTSDRPGPVRTIAFVLFSYGPNEPAGYERTVGALAAGCRELGITPLIVTSGPAEPGDADHPDMVRLASLTLPRPIMKPGILTALKDPEPVRAELRDLLARHRVDLVVWVDALYGLGYLDAAPAGVATVLQVHKVRADSFFDQAIAAAGAVLPISPYMVEEARAHGYDTSGWTIVPNPLMAAAVPVPALTRERLRQDGPVRIVSRAEPFKGLAELLSAIPDGWQRPVELVLARAGFEYWPGMQDEVVTAVRAAAAERPDVVTVLDPLPWEKVQPFFAGAAATIIASYEPETFCNTAAEAMSTGTPVVGFGIGNLPHLVGDGGVMVALERGYGALWQEVGRLTDDEARYHDVSASAARRTAEHAPASIVRALIAATRTTAAG
ncbi:glycosyltransferase family 4 protein [Kitasatospora sp. NPDC059327]|uniref:glycosyltransferase family 4 protein n=1 Tax=Kitasatospora sp. NPDC059327 TaxID=3346803 RepID=UPI003674A98A